MSKKKTWREKLADDKGLPKVEVIEGRLRERWGEGTVVIPAPREVDSVMKTVPSGQVITIDQIRQTLARRHDATIACPLTTGIFAWIASHVASEDSAAGNRDVTPYWRTLKARGELNQKYPGGVLDLKRRLEAEGHRVIQKGTRYFVADYEKAMTREII